MGKLNLRQRNRLEAKRRLQVVALSLFEEKGFDDVTMQDVATEGGVSESTLYRYFGTKESLVVWDEYDLDLEIGRRLCRNQGPAAAFRDSMITVFATQGSLPILLRRVRFLYATPQVYAAAVEQDLEDRDDLAGAFAMVRGSKTRSLEDDVLAGACMAALDAALNHWQESNGELNLSSLLEQAFATCFPAISPLDIAS
ncbi:MAG: TetR family transcriptional regulator [Planctomycetota bacterium]